MIQKEHIEQLVQRFNEKLIKNHYSEWSQKRYHRILTYLLQYCEERDIVSFDMDTGMAFLEERFGITGIDDLGDNRFKLKVINELGYFQINGIIPFRMPKSEIHFPNWFKEPYARFENYRRYNGITEYTIQKQTLYFERFADYLDVHGLKDIKDLDITLIHGFIASLAIYSKAVIYNTIAAVRMFFEFLYQKKYVPVNYHYLVANIKYSHQSIIPSAYSRDEVSKLLASVDRGNATGKRDYAMLLIAACLGLRISDICALKFENIDWENNSIEITQLKTGKLVIFPLTAEIGNALIDYIKYGRPKSADRVVFLRHISPINPIHPSSFHCMIYRYFLSAGINIPKEKKHGPHAIRHSLATALMEDNVPLPVISEVLGHANTNSTKIYLKVDIAHLRKCALSVPSFDFDIESRRGAE